MNDLAYQMESDQVDYEQGIACCKRGDAIPHNATEAFKAGYGEQYAKEQCLTYQALEMSREKRL